MNPVASTSDNINPPVFITGNSRSGTTMMSRILGNHDLVFSFQELHFFDELTTSSTVFAETEKQEALKLFAILLSIQRDGYFGSRKTAPFIEEAQAALNAETGHSKSEVYKQFLYYETKREHKSIPCDQTPQNIFSIDQIIRIFPDARIIAMVRDPREVLLSQKFKWKRRKLSGGKIPLIESIRSRINYHPVTISKIWRSVMLQINKYESLPNLLVIRYEDLIRTPETTIQKVCVHIGIGFQSSMLDIPVVGSSNFSDSNNRGIDSAKSKQWEKGGLSMTEIEICQRINSGLMKQYHYDPVETGASPISVWAYKISRPFRMSMAVFFNLHRLKDPKAVLKRLRGN